MNCKKWLCFFFALVMVSALLIATAASAQAASGDVVMSGVSGDCTYSVVDTMTPWRPYKLVISGNGAMETYGMIWVMGLYGASNYEVTTAPWMSFVLRDKINAVEIQEGVTSIGGDAFCTSTVDADNGIRSVTIPVSVTEIGMYAFSGNSSLTDVYYAGTKAQWQAINIGSYNEPLSSATIHYNCAPPVLTAQSGNRVASEGDVATFSVTVTGANLSYQWQYRPSASYEWSETYWSGYNTAALKVTASAGISGYQYRCIISNSYGSVTSTPVTLTVKTASPTITTQPADATVALGKTTTFKVVASGSGLSYQWEYSKNGGSSWTAWSGKTSASLSVTGSATNNGCLYRCKVTNSAGSVVSNAATLTVTGASGAPSITTQPANLSTTLGKSVTFKVVASGSGLSYQWQFSKDNGASWTAWSGKTSASLAVTASATNNGCLYRCVIKNSAGSVTSSSARLTVTDAKPAILVQPANASVALGKTVTLKVVAWGSGLSYQWQYKKTTDTDWHSWSGKTSSQLEITGSASNNGCLYRCVIQNSIGSVTSAEVKLTVS